MCRERETKEGMIGNACCVTDACVGKISGGVEDFRDTEIAKSDSIVFQEDVLCFEIAVQDFLLVEIEKRECHLREPVVDLVFWEVLALLVFDFIVHVTALAVDHHDVEELLAIHVRILVRDNVRMPQFLQQSHFVFCVLAILLTHVTRLDLLVHVQFVLALVTHQIHLAECARSD